MVVYQVESKKSVADAAKAFEAAAQKYKFGVLAVHDLRSKMNEKGVPFDRDCLVYEICNPQQAKKVLDANMEISTALPCRVSLYPKGSGTTLATIRPTAMLEMFNTPSIKAVAEEVEDSIFKMMDEAAR